MNRLFQITAAALLFSAFALPATAAEVRSGISTRETYVGLPVTFQVQISNATKFDPPTMPEVSGLRIESAGQPSRSTRTTIINGSMSSTSSVTYSYSITPLAAGKYQIPPISVQADGQTIETRSFEFVASKSETGDLLFVEVTGNEQQIYVGQALELQLNIYVRPYRDKVHGVTLSEGDMWSLIAERTSWGPFQERIEEYAAKNQRPVGTEVLRADSEGVDHSYYLYEIDATIYPKKPGRIDANDVQVMALYPTALGESQDPFAGMFAEFGFGGRSPISRGLEIESVRPIVAEAKVEPIEVEEIPVANRPADYRGAVGKYQIVTGAKPTDVKAGDPITLIIGIAGTGPMDLVQAPPLAELPALNKNFKVPNEPLAGYVEGARKVFTTTIRPRSAGITEIPSIPFTYFDPQVGKFMTAKSAPITIHVTPADTLALDAVVGRSKASAGTNDSTSSIAAAGRPVLTNYAGSDLLVNQSPAAEMSRGIWLAIVAPPIAVLGMLLSRSRTGMALVAGRFRSASRKCQAEIEAATRRAEVGDALRRFLVRRAGLATSADTAAIVGSLRATGQRNSAVRCERLLEQCDELSVAGFSSAPSLAETKQLTIQLIQDIETESNRLRPQASRTTRAGRTVRATTALVAFALLTFGSSSATFAAEPLTATQQHTLLAEATANYDAARAKAGVDSADSKEAFAAAADKYQLLVDAGITNGHLYVNLGNAYLESGASGRAIANYRRALAIDPTDHAARANLAFAESSLNAKTENAPPADRSFTAKLIAGNELVSQFVRPNTILVVGLVSWFAVWIAIGLRLAEIRFPWKSVAFAAIALSAVSASSYYLTLESLSLPTAVVVSSIELRGGDGEQFATTSGARLVEGQSVDFLRHRGEWSQVRTAHGQTGWLPRLSIETL
jgi:tetratricopeptide (TPR) repeat protein